MRFRLHNKLVEMGYSTEDFPGDWDTEWEDIMENPHMFSAESEVPSSQYSAQTLEAA